MVQAADLGDVTIEAAAHFVDALLLNPARTFDDCVAAQAVVDGINEGAPPECEADDD